MKRSEAIAKQINKLSKQITSITLKIEKLSKQKRIAEMNEAKAHLPKVPCITKNSQKLSSEKRYEIFNRYVKALKVKYNFSIYRDGSKSGVSVKLGDSYYQKVVPEKVRKQLRMIADKVSVSNYTSYFDDETSKVERYIFNVQTRKQKLAA